MKPDCATVDTLSIFPFIQKSDLTALKDEFPMYQVAAEDVSPDHSSFEFWQANVQKLPVWVEVAKRVLLVQPSSGAAE